MANILIVEGDDLNCRVLNDLLQANGYATLIARNGSEALDAALEQHPDLVLMEIALPGLSGLHVVHAMKREKKLRAIPVIAVSACAMGPDRQRALAAGFDGFVGKPYSGATILETIATHMATSREEEARSADA